MANVRSAKGNAGRNIVDREPPPSTALIEPTQQPPSKDRLFKKWVDNKGQEDAFD